jgi:hypothetical protein
MHIEASGMKGDVLVVAWIGDASKGKTGDWSASQKLLAAVLQKLQLYPRLRRDTPPATGTQPNP